MISTLATSSPVQLYRWVEAMLYAIHCLDAKDAASIRVSQYEAHKAHLKTVGSKLALAGPLLSEDGLRRIGSLLVIEADNLAQARDFNARDPFSASGVWSNVQIHPFLVISQYLESLDA